MKKSLPLLFKGSRDYLHGSDFFNLLVNFSSEVTGNSDSYVERLTFRKNASHMCELVDEKPMSQNKVVGQVRYSGANTNNEANLWIVETNLPVLGRYPFDETVVSKNITMDIQQRTAMLSSRSIFTPIEEVIILTKCLNYQISPITNGSWLFGQLNLNSPLVSAYRVLEIKMKSLIEGKFSVNDIIVDNHLVGSIRFIVGMK